MASNNTLMFQVGVQEVDNQLKKLEERLKKLTTNYEKITIKVQVDNLEVLTNAIAKLGSGKEIDSLRERIENVKKTVQSTGEAAKKAANDEADATEKAVKSMLRYQKLLNDSESILARISNISSRGESLKIDTSALNTAKNDIENFVRQLSKLSETEKADAKTIAALSQLFGVLKSSYKDVIAEANKFNNTTDRQGARAEERIKKLGIAFNELKNYMKANGGSEEMRRLQTEIQVAIQKMRGLMNAGNYTGAIQVYERISGVIRQATTATREYDRAKHQSVSSTSQLTAEEQRLATAIKGTTETMRGQSQLFSDLKSLAMQYLGVWGAQNFVHNIIEIGGQLERQRLSMGAILGDAQKANVIFGQIKDLAIKSPFGVVELDQYSKQLAAYGFQYHELFDMTKRLADISAGAGTDISRIALALGHVRSEGALSGYTLRQFAMNNIPMLKKLSEYLSQIEGHLVTTAEIRERVSKKLIGYDDVVAVIKQLTDEGGMFYNMQETISESVSARFKNLKDAMSIMYGELAESKIGSVLKDTAVVLTTLTRHWQVLFATIGGGMLIMGSWKASMFASNYAMRQNIASITMSAASMKNLNREQVKNMVTSGVLTREDLLLAVATKKLRVEQAELAAAHYGVSAAQLQQIRTSTTLAGVMRGMNGILGKMFSPQMLLFAAAEVGIGMWSYYREWVDKIDTKTKEMVDLQKSRIKDLEKAQKDYAETEPASDLGYKNAIEDMQKVLGNSNAYTKTIDEQLSKTDKLPEKYHILAGAIDEAVKKQREMLAWEDTLGEAIKSSSWGFLGANEKFNNLQNVPWFNNDIMKNMADVNESYGDMRKIIDGAWEYKDALKAVIDEMIKSETVSEGFRSRLENAPFEEQIRLLAESSYWESVISKVNKMQSGFDAAAARIKKASNDVTDNWDEIANDDIPKIFASIAEQRGQEEKEFREWCVENPKEFNTMMEALLDRLDVDQPKIRQKIKMMFYDFARIGDLEKELAEGARIGGTLFSSDNINTLFPVEEKADVAPEKNEPRTKDKGSKEDKDAKNLRERIRVLKEAADAYKYWRDKVGERGAEVHVNEEFGEVLARLGYQFKDIKQLRTTIQGEIKKYQDIYDASGKKRPQLLEAIKEGAKTDASLGRNDFEKDTERFLSQTQIELDNLTRSWETFNSVREATGNVQLAIRLSGAQYANGQNRNLADAVKEKIERDFASVGAVEIPFDINLSDEQIADAIKDAMPAESEERIKGFVEEYKKWRDLQRDVLKNDISIFTQLVGSVKDYDNQVKRINDRLEQQKKANAELLRLNKISQDEADEADRIATIQAIEEKWMASVEYAQLMNNSLAMTRDEVENGINRAMDILDQKMRSNVITAQEYADEMQKIRNIQSEWEKNSFFGSNGSFASFVNGGLAGMINYRKGQVNAAQAAMANEAQKGFFGMDMVAYKNAVDKLSENQDALDKLEGLEKMLGDFEALANAMDPVIDLFDELAMTGLGDILGDAKSALSAASSVGGGAAALFGASAGPYGAVIGASMSILQSVFATHDDSLKRQIDAIKEEVDALDANTEAIKSYRDRTLGYDTGELRKQMAGLYSNIVRQREINVVGVNRTVDYNSAAMNALREYYTMNGAGSGYRQELENLKQQREDYIKMYDLENDKKKKSQDALDEYKKKIADLDEQIRYFAEDLSKDLFGIDLKGWAGEVGDALMTAFENGEDAAKAFNDTVQDIMKQVLNKMLSIGVIEPMMDKLRKRLFGENGKSGSFDANNPEGTIDAAMQDIAEFFGNGGEGRQMIEAAESFYKRWQALMESQGLTLKNEEKKTSGTGSSIKSITEQTADLLASYINAIRADVSVDRALLAQYIPVLYNEVTRSSTSLRNIENHTAAIMRSNDVVAEKITNLDNNINGLKNKTWKVPMA